MYGTRQVLKFTVIRFLALRPSFYLLNMHKMGFYILFKLGDREPLKRIIAFGLAYKFA